MTTSATPIGIGETVQNAASDGFGSNFNGTPFCLPPPNGGLLATQTHKLTHSTVQSNKSIIEQKAHSAMTVFVLSFCMFDYMTQAFASGPGRSFNKKSPQIVGPRQAHQYFSRQTLMRIH